MTKPKKRTQAVCGPIMGDVDIIYPYMITVAAINMIISHAPGTEWSDDLAPTVVKRMVGNELHCNPAYPGYQFGNRGLFGIVPKIIPVLNTVCRTGPICRPSARVFRGYGSTLCAYLAIFNFAM